MLLNTNKFDWSLNLVMYISDYKTEHALFIVTHLVFRDNCLGVLELTIGYGVFLRPHWLVYLAKDIIERFVLLIHALKINRPTNNYRNICFFLLNPANDVFRFVILFS